jgi:hypothetical protein
MNKRIIVSAFLLLLTIRPSLSQSESDPVKFLFEYYSAKEKSKSPLDTREFMSTAVKKEQDKFTKDMAEKGGLETSLLRVVGDFMSQQEPTKIRIKSKNIQPNTATFELDAVEIPQHYKDMAKDATSSSLKGIVDLVRENSQWKVAKDYWCFEAIGKNSKVRQTVGINPDSDAQ